MSKDNALLVAGNRGYRTVSKKLKPPHWCIGNNRTTKARLDEFVRKFEEDTDANPRDIQKLELLVQIYVLTENNDKVQGITDRLIAASPSDPVYQDMRLTQLMRQNADYGTFKKLLDGMTALKPEVRLSHIARFSMRLYTRGQKEEAARMLGELDTTNVTDLNTGATLIDAFARKGSLTSPRTSSPNFRFQRQQDNPPVCAHLQFPAAVVAV